MNFKTYQQTIGDRSVNLADRLSEVVRLANTVGAGQEEADMLRSLSRLPDEDVIVRGYAAWAANRIIPLRSSSHGTIYHVAQRHTEACDDNRGTSDRPWRTIQQAAEQLLPGDSVIIHEGIYRECVHPYLGGTEYDRMISYVAADGEFPIITAADHWERTWRPLGGNRWATAYERLPWDHPEKWSNPQNGAMRRSEQLIVDGVLLRHVDGKENLDAESNSFYTDDEAGEIWIHLDGGPPPSQRFIERVVRQQCFAPAVRGLGYVHVEGLRMMYGAAPESTGANWDSVSHRSVMSVRSGHHWIVRNNTIEWGNAQGMDIGGEGWGADVKSQPIVSEQCGYHQIIGNQVNHHGVAGIVGWDGRQEYLLLEDNVTSWNCRKGNDKAYEGGGVKIHNAKDCIIRRHQSIENLSYGIWLDHRCERNRITECIVVNNVTNGIFHEVSQGPVLIDNNVVIENRNAALEDGIYSHDGNNAMVVNNYIEGCACGIRMRNLFGRLDDGVPTTTSYNRAYNNFIVNSGSAAVSFNPDVPRSTDNRSDGNIYWQQGRKITMRLENEEGCGVSWESTDIGAVLEKSGEGNLDIPFAAWTDVLNKDQDSLLFPSFLLFPDDQPEKIRERLLELWQLRKSVTVDDPARGRTACYPAAELIGAALPQLANGKWIRDIWLAPDSCLQLWLVDNKLKGLLWKGDQQFEWRHDIPQLLMKEAVSSGSGAALSAAAGETLRVPVRESSRIVYAGMEAVIEAGHLAMTMASDGISGEYSVVVLGEDEWKQMRVGVVHGFALERIYCSRSPSHAIIVDITNHQAAEAEGTISIVLGGRYYECAANLKPKWRTEISVPVDFDGAGEAVVRIEFPGFEASSSVLVSFCIAVRSPYGNWNKKYPVEGIPGGAFPAGMEAFALYTGGLKGEWGVVYDRKGLHILVEVYDKKHWQTGEADRISSGDSIQILLQARNGSSALLLDAALHATTGVTLLYRTKSPDTNAFPIGKTEDVAADISRVDETTYYRISIPWPMIGYPETPSSGTALYFSLVVNNRDNADMDLQGLQWFFGIRRNGSSENGMGTLWLD